MQKPFDRLKLSGMYNVCICINSASHKINMLQFKSAPKTSQNTLMCAFSVYHEISQTIRSFSRYFSKRWKLMQMSNPSPLLLVMHMSFCCRFGMETQHSFKQSADYVSECTLADKQLCNTNTTGFGQHSMSSS